MHGHWLVEWEGIMFLSINNILGAKIMLVHGLVKFVLLLLTTYASTSRMHSRNHVQVFFGLSISLTPNV